MSFFLRMTKKESSLINWGRDSTQISSHYRWVWEQLKHTWSSKGGGIVGWHKNWFILLSLVGVYVLTEFIFRILYNLLPQQVVGNGVLVYLEKVGLQRDYKTLINLEVLLKYTTQFPSHYWWSLTYSWKMSTKKG